MIKINCDNIYKALILLSDTHWSMRNKKLRLFVGPTTKSGVCFTPKPYLNSDNFFDPYLGFIKFS